jgi:predicted nucleic-acid-binding protein
VLKEKLNGNAEQYADLIETLLKDNKIKINKDTKFTTYYEVL